MGDQQISKDAQIKRLARELVRGSIIEDAASRFVEMVLKEAHDSRIKPLQDRIEELEAKLDNLSDKLELERALTDGAHCRAGKAEAKLAKAVEALTPSGDTEAEYAGEFHISVYDAEDEDGNEIWRKVPVDWTTIKAIMAAIKGRAAIAEINGGGNE